MERLTPTNPSSSSTFEPPTNVVSGQKVSKSDAEKVIDRYNELVKKRMNKKH